MAWTKHFKKVEITTQSSKAVSPVAATSKFSNWLPEVYQGPPNRLQRYIQYEQMDMDHEINSALDTIAEFSTHLNERTGLPFSIRWKETPTQSELAIIESVLSQWCYLNEFPKRIFRIFRSSLMYGDQFFIRDPETYKLLWVDPSNLESVIVNESNGKTPEVYNIKDMDFNLQSLVASNVHRNAANGYNASDNIFPGSPLTGQANFRTAAASPGLTNQGGYTGGEQVFPVDARHVVQISLTEGMDGAWPFGISILEPIFKIYKQKELIEDSVLIYRIHRAPERRVFKIDVGTMPPHKAQQYIERVKYEVQQKRIPSRNGGGQSVTDSAYNPLSVLEDYYFAQSADGRGSSIDVLPGGENIGQIDDLRYFNNKMMRALGVPSSYLPTGPEDGSAGYNDGRVGTAFIQEFRFNKTCQRYQQKIVDSFDQEFKRFIKFLGYEGIDTSTFELKFEEPQNFSKYRQLEIDSAMINNFNAISEVPYISKRFALKKYLGLTLEEISENETLWAEEKHGTKSYNNGSGDIGSGEVSPRDVGVNISNSADDFDASIDADELGSDFEDELDDTSDSDNVGSDDEV